MRVGFLDPDAAYKAVIHENGVEEKNIKPRPFMAPAMEAGREKWKQMARNEVDGLLDGTITLRQLFAVLAQNAVERIQQAIDDLQTPALKQKTIDRKTAKKETDPSIKYPSKPLIETSHMKDSVMFDVEDAE